MILSSLIVGKGPVVVILHGLFGEGVNWLGISKELASRFEVHLIDQRNHGKSFHDPEHNYFVLAQDLNNYIKEKRISTFSLIGHSMGGHLLLLHQEITQDNFKSIVLSAPMLGFKYEKFLFIIAFLSKFFLNNLEH